MVTFNYFILAGLTAAMKLNMWKLKWISQGWFAGGDGDFIVSWFDFGRYERKVRKIQSLYRSDALIVVSDTTLRMAGCSVSYFLSSKIFRGISAMQSHISDWACDSGWLDGSMIEETYINASMAFHSLWLEHHDLTFPESHSSSQRALRNITALRLRCSWDLCSRRRSLPVQWRERLLCHTRFWSSQREMPQQLGVVAILHGYSIAETLYWVRGWWSGTTPLSQRT